VDKALSRLKELDTEMNLLSNVTALLGWDQETYMPPGGLDSRGEQSALMEGIVHDRAMSPEIPALLKDLGVSDASPSGDPSLPEEERLYLRAFYRGWSREVKLPGDFVREKARAVSHSQAAWVQARKANDFSAFEPHLSSMVALAKREAGYYGYQARPYDGLLDLYEPGLTQAGLSDVFARLKAGLSSLLSRIGSRPQIDDSILHRPCPADKQEAFSRKLMPLLGFDGESGRLDRSAHPFTTTIGHGDVRITTRYLEDFFASSISSTIHETGHALYELGLPAAKKRLAVAEAASMAVHESQSRFWENVVGRSLPFWKGQFPALKADLAPVLDGVDVESFYRAFNKVSPGLIRVDSDEVGYSLHVVLRFELEAALMSGALAVEDLPSAWNTAMKAGPGIEPPDDTNGCLQDIHWSIGLIGYFPSYALGNLYAGQFSAAMRRDLGPLETDMEAGRFGRILEWLRKNIHSKGSSRTPGELLREVTGADLDPAHFLRYLEGKYSGIYGFSPAAV
jgi:carboxypeptidase Taq